MPIPQTIPPMNWLRARRALRMRPAANAPISRVTRTMPSSGSTSTSANWAPNECSAYLFRSSDGATSPTASTDSRGRPPIASSFCRNARHAASTAEATLAAVIDPPDRGASGISVSPRSNLTFSYGTPSVSAATCAITV